MNNKISYICGERECVDKKERDKYFKKNLSLEVKTFSKKKDKEIDLIKLNVNSEYKNYKKKKIKLEKLDLSKEEKLKQKREKIELKKKIRAERKLAKAKKNYSKAVKGSETKIILRNY